METLTEKNRNRIEALAWTISGCRPEPDTVALNPMLTPAKVKPNARSRAEPLASITK